MYSNDENSFDPLSPKSGFASKSNASVDQNKFPPLELIKNVLQCYTTQFNRSYARKTYQETQQSFVTFHRFLFFFFRFFFVKNFFLNFFDIFMSFEFFNDVISSFSILRNWRILHNADRKTVYLFSHLHEM